MRNVHLRKGSFLSVLTLIGVNSSEFQSGKKNLAADFFVFVSTYPFSWQTFFF